MSQHQKRKQNLVTFTTLSVLAALIILLGLTPLGLIPLGFIYVTILCVPVIVGTLYLGGENGVILGLCFGLVSLYTAITKPSGLVAPLVQASPLLVALMCIVPRLCVPLVAWYVYRWLERKSEDQSADSAALVFGTLLAALTGLIIVVMLFLSGALKLPEDGETFGFVWEKNQIMLLVGCMVLLAALIGALVASFLSSNAFKNTIAAHAPAAVAAVCGSLTNTVLYLGSMLLFYVMCGIDAAGVLALIGGTGLIAGLSEAVVAAILVPPIVTAVKKIRIR